MEAYLVGAARVLVDSLEASAVGILRRFSGAGRDYALLVPRDGEPAERIVPLSTTEHRPRTETGQARVATAFQDPQLVRLARERGLSPSGVLLSPVVHHGRRVVALEVADPAPGWLRHPARLQELLGEDAALFELAVVQERLRRERLETRLLLEVARELGRTYDLQDLLRSVLELLRQIVPFDAAAIYVLGEDGLTAVTQSVSGYTPGQEDFLRLKLDQGLVGWVARTSEGVIVPDVRSDPRYFDARDETRSEMVAPLRSGGSVIGVFNLESDRKNAYTPHDLELLESFGGQAAAALERARLLEDEQSRRRLTQELQIARRIQLTFLPRPSERLRTLGLAGRTLPSKEMSGDYFDLLERDDGLVALAVADVSGKGIPASLIMSSLRAAFRLLATGESDPGELCRKLNEFLLASLRETEFVTGVFGLLDPARRRLLYASAGHEPPLLLRGDGTVEWLENGGLILGAFPDQEYESTPVELRARDVLVFYTDGVTEVYRPDRGEFGREGLLEVVRAHRELPARELCSAVLRAVREFAEGPLPDDLTLVALAPEGRMGR
jgi:serine phosphatase RsbU (regulator of sigma subunit)